MARARELRPRTRTQLDAMRDNLSQLERSLPGIGGMGQRAADLLQRLGAVYDDMARLREYDSDIDLRPEEARLSYIEDRLRGDRTAVLVKEIARTTGWDALRGQVGADSGQWWWYLDQELAQRRRSQARRWLLRGGLIGVALILLVAAYRLFLAPSPEMGRKIALMQSADVYVDRGELDQALATYQEAAANDPNDAEIQLWLGVLYEQTGQPSESLVAFRSARQLSPSLLNYYLLRARMYLQTGLNDKAGDDVMAALSIDPNSNQALFLLADVLERQGYHYEAMDLFLAVSERTGDPSLQVLAKVRYGMLLEAGPRNAATPTPVDSGAEAP